MVQTEAIRLLECGTEAAAENAAMIAESQTACVMLTSELDLLLEAINRVNAMSCEMRERLDGADVLIENLRSSLEQGRLESTERTIRFTTPTSKYRFSVG